MESLVGACHVQGQRGTPKSCWAELESHSLSHHLKWHARGGQGLGPLASCLGLRYADHVSRLSVPLLEEVVGGEEAQP